MASPTKILVIKLGALGDVVQGFRAFVAIRARHPGARITLLTTRPYAVLARRSPWFDEVWDDGRPDWHDLPAVWRLARRLRRGGFDRVYDLQTSGRSTRYRLFVGARAEWSGVARTGSHPHSNPGRNAMHTVDRQREQLEIAGIHDFPPVDLAWLEAEATLPAVEPPFGLLIPAASPHRPGKRWPVDRFAELAATVDVPCLVLGTAGEKPLAEAILARAPGSQDLTGKTGFADIAALARRAAFCVGNDTGPTHLVAAAGCPTVALFGDDSDPALCAPRGDRVTILRHRPLADLPVATVMRALEDIR